MIQGSRLLCKEVVTDDLLIPGLNTQVEKRVQEFFRGLRPPRSHLPVYDIDQNVSYHSRVLCRSRCVI